MALVEGILNLYMLVLLVRVAVSWMRISPHNSFVHFIYTVTDPVLNPIRRIIGPLGGLDFSPLIVFFLIHLIKKLMFNM